MSEMIAVPEHVETSSLEATCSRCGHPMARIVTVDGPAVDRPRIVTEGSFVQDLGEDGTPVGPFKPFCRPCVNEGAKPDPIDHPIE